MRLGTAVRSKINLQQHYFEQTCDVSKNAGTCRYSEHRKTGIRRAMTEQKEQKKSLRLHYVSRPKQTDEKYFHCSIKASTHPPRKKKKIKKEG